MEAIISRTPASFRLRTDLLNLLKKKAKASNRSLNNYVESALMEYVYNEPNANTVEAINEVKNGKSAGTLDLSDFDTFIRQVELMWVVVSRNLDYEKHKVQYTGQERPEALSPFSWQIEEALFDS